MRTLAVDFEFSVLGPLLLWLLIALVTSVRGYIWTDHVLYEHSHPDDAPISEWERHKFKQKARNSTLGSAIGLLLLVCAIWLTGDEWKVDVAFQLWSALRILSALSLFFVLAMAWYFGERQQWWKLLVLQL